MKQNERLDEMQEQKLLKIEHNMAWFTFGMLVLAIILQMIFCESENMAVAIRGESIILLLASLYTCFSSVKHGVISRRPAKIKQQNIAGTIVGGVGFGAVLGIIVFRHSGDPILSLAFFSVTSVFLCALIGLMLFVTTKAYKKRMKQLEEEKDDCTER